MMLIGLTGAAGVGKDTAATYLQDRHNFEAMAFADPIRAGLHAMFGLDELRFRPVAKELPLERLGGRSPRELMQLLGTEFGRHQVSPSVWLDQASRVLMQKLDDHDRTASHQPLRLVVTDVRFDNEAAWVRQYGGVVIRIMRQTAPQVAGHISEAGVDTHLVDYTVRNEGTLNEFYHRIEGVMTELARQADGLAEALRA